MDLSVIIVSWNVREKLRENLKAIFEEEEKGTKSPIGDLVPAEPHLNPLIIKERGINTPRILLGYPLPTGRQALKRGMHTPLTPLPSHSTGQAKGEVRGFCRR